MNRIPAYSLEEERSRAMRGLDEDSWLKYMDEFRQTDNDLVAFLKIPALTEKVRDRIASKIYNLPQEDSEIYEQCNIFRPYRMMDEKFEMGQNDAKILIADSGFSSLDTDVELGIRQ
jgi:hypothetical protein